MEKLKNYAINHKKQTTLGIIMVLIAVTTITTIVINTNQTQKEDIAIKAITPIKEKTQKIREISKKETDKTVKNDNNDNITSDTNTVKQNKENAQTSQKQTESIINDNTSSGSTANGITKPAEQEPVKTLDSKPATHTHKWVDHNIQVPHEEKYVVREWDEQIQTGTEPVYQTKYQCPFCDFVGGSQDVLMHATENHAEQLANGDAELKEIQVQTGTKPVYTTEHKVEYGTHTTYTTKVDYVYCSECGEHK